MGELTTMTSDELIECEQTIERGKKAFVEVGLALMRIRDAGGYRMAGYKTFEQYCRDRWGWSRKTATIYIGAQRVARLLPQSNNLDLTQAAELSRLVAPSTHGDKRRKAIDTDLVQEVARELDFSKATVKDVAKAVDAKLAQLRNSTVTYHNQPGIHATRGTVPLEGTSHIYTVNKLLWPEEVESVLASLLIGRSLHLCCGRSKLGTVRLDLYEEDVDIRADAANTGLADKSFDTVLCDPPYNGNFQWNHDLLKELARLASRRIVFQHWFIPANPDGYYKKAHYFQLAEIYAWQPKTYFGRAQLISVFNC